MCSRIYQVIRKVEYAEQNQIAELAMIPAKEARIHLYKMYKDKYITFQVSACSQASPPLQSSLWEYSRSVAASVGLYT